MSENNLKELQQRYDRELSKLNRACELARAPKLSSEERFYILNTFLPYSTQLELAYQYGYAKAKGLGANVINVFEEKRKSL